MLVLVGVFVCCLLGGGGGGIFFSFFSPTSFFDIDWVCTGSAETDFLKRFLQLSITAQSSVTTLYLGY